VQDINDSTNALGLGIKMIAYKIVMERDTNDTLLVSCPDLPGVNTFGEDREDAIRHAVDAIETWIASLISDGLDVPRPLVPLPALTTLKLELYWTLREKSLTRADLLRVLDWERESVDRLFRLDHHSRVDQIEKAFEAMHKRIDWRVTEPHH
jgi:antitoxin HicB